MHRHIMEDLYLSYAPTVFKYLMCLTRDRHLAEDLTADTFEVAFRNIEKYQGKSKLSVWLCGIAKHLYFAERRRIHKTHWVALEEAPLISPESIEQNYLYKEDRLTLYRELQSLSPETRSVFYLRLTGDMTFDEIGDLMGRSGSWARVTYYRGKEELKRRMQLED